MIPHRTSSRSRFANEADARRSGSTALTTAIVPGLPIVAAHRDNEPLTAHTWLVPSRRVGTPLSLPSTPNLGATQTGQRHQPSLWSPFGRSYAGINPPVDGQSVPKPLSPTYLTVLKVHEGKRERELRQHCRRWPPNGTNQAIPRHHSPDPRSVRKQTVGVRRSPGGGGARKEGNGAPPKPGGTTTTPPSPRGLPAGVGNGQELSLPQAERRGDNRHKGEALCRAEAGGAVTVPGKPALPPNGGRSAGRRRPSADA
jgi:hypothetical protein